MDHNMPSTSGIDLFNVPEADEEFEDYFLADSGSELDDSIEDPQFTLEGLESDTTEIYHEESEEEQIRQPTPEDEGWTEVRLPLEKPTFSGTSGPKAAFFPGTLSPYSVFKQFFDEELFRTIKLETNKYARMVIDKERKKGPLNPRGLLAKWKAVSIAELKIFLAIIIHMSLVVKPRLREYWSNHIGMRTAFCKSTGMARERFEAILSMLHLNDNMLYIPHGQPGYDPIYKIRTLFDSLVNKFRTWYSPDEKLTIDEAICPFRGRVHFRVYIKGKPHKYGIKIYEICESSTGYTCNLDIYTGRHPHQDLQYNSILSLVDRIAEPYYQKGHIIYFDRWFSSPQLFNHLWEKKTLAVGTVRHNRKGLPKKAFSKKLKKGESIFCQNSQLLALKWRDTRDVFMIATTQDSSMIQAQKKIRRQPQTISITKPAIVVDYNKNKAGVDRSDQFMAYYPFHRRTLKWWKKLFFHIFGLTIVNSHIVYNKLTTGRKMPLREYHLAIMERLMEEAGTEILDEQPSASGSSERLIGKHFLTKIPATGKTTIQKRCKVCSDKGKRSSGKRYRVGCVAKVVINNTELTEHPPFGVISGKLDDHVTSNKTIVLKRVSQRHPGKTRVQSLTNNYQVTKDDRNFLDCHAEFILLGDLPQGHGLTFHLSEVHRGVDDKTERFFLRGHTMGLEFLTQPSLIVYITAVKQNGGMARKEFIKQLALQLMRDALNMRNQAKNLSRDLQVLIQKHAGTSSLEGYGGAASVLMLESAAKASMLGMTSNYRQSQTFSKVCLDHGAMINESCTPIPYSMRS
ncbi:PGBD5 [Cordylochernes scorpioides]|uniref:PGBD5 n=1 Tax=Cordylochernes scorpioides TaxID=51811 RepID=A0ABY6K003_9ARAC|nr:PGBD5 [Cordylochernes scorpioides]